MRQNAARLNRMQIREQEALNRQRRLQDDAAARREEEAIRRTQAQYDHVASHGYGRNSLAGSSTATAGGAGGAASSSAVAAGASGATTGGGRRRSLNANVAHGDNVQIRVYVRECDEDAEEVFTYKENGGPATTVANSAGARAATNAAIGGGVGRRTCGGEHSSTGPSCRPGGLRSTTKADELVAPNRARVPRYLQQRKAEMAAEKAAVAAEVERQRQLSQIPPGHRRVSEEEKADTLRQLAERQQELETQLAKIPIRFDTQSIQQRRRAIEEELRELEAKRNKYSTKNPLYVPLS